MGNGNGISLSVLLYLVIIMTLDILTSRSRMSLPYICRFSKTLAIVDIEYLDKLGTWCGLVDDISPHFLLVIMNF